MAEALKNLQDKVSDLTSNVSNSIPDEIHEGHLTKLIENQTAKIPSVAFLNLAMGSIALSLGFAVFSRNKPMANFVGQWAPTFLLLGIYNKLVKLQGSDQHDRSPSKPANLTSSLSSGQTSSASGSGSMKKIGI